MSEKGILSQTQVCECVQSVRLCVCAGRLSPEANEAQGVRCNNNNKIKP